MAANIYPRAKSNQKAYDEGMANIDWSKKTVVKSKAEKCDNSAPARKGELTQCCNLVKKMVSARDCEKCEFYRECDE